MVAGAAAKGRRVVFVAPALSLIDQTVERFWAEGIRDVGVIQGNHPLTDWSKPVQVASVETLRSRDCMPEAGLVLVDEAHRRSRWLEGWMACDAGKTPVVGLSATPWTKGLGRHFDDLVVGSTTGELIEGGWLSPFRVFAPSTPDMTGVRKTAGDFNGKQSGERMNEPALVADVVTTWLEKGEGRPTLVFAVDRKHAVSLQKDFEAANVRTGYVDAYTSREDRQVVERQFHNGDVQVVVNVGCLTTGIDWDVRCIVLARPTASEMLHVQIIGRGLRTAPGKADCLVLDHAGNHTRLGFVTDIHHGALHDGEGDGERKPLEDVPLPKECPACAFLRPPKVRECPACGHVPALPRSEVETADGELVEMTAGGKKAGKAWTMDEKQAWYSGFIRHAADRGYRSGWAFHAYREKFGVRPQFLDDVPSSDVPQEVRSWVRARNIRQAKRRQKEAA
jgi:superfamily II DNA or RNA helicase